MNVAIRWVWLVLVLQACGDDGSIGGDGGLGDDAAVVDAAIDAAGVPFVCPISGTPPVCGATTAPTTPAAGGTCNPLTQTGCAVGEKCTWIIDQASPTIGHTGCAPDGTEPVGCACTRGTAGATGYDDCAKGSTCVSGTCKQICDDQGGAPMCGTGYACTGYQDVFDIGGTRVAGLCDATCDPLTQCTSVSPTPTACGATNPAMPTRGCYGISSYSCAVAVVTSPLLTDRMIPRGSSSGAAYLNGCAPGFIPMFYSMTGSTQVLCTGFCAALEIDNTPAHAGNSKGDASAPGKLPDKAQAFIGDATCDIGKKGSEATSTCKFIWPFLEDPNGGGILPEFQATGLVDKLGVCFATAHFLYDSNADAMPDAPYPACNTLPPRSAATPGDFDDAADFGCQKLANSALVGPALQDIRVGLRESVPLYRHTFD